jgi:DNA-binding response OmpR family regulator
VRSTDSDYAVARFRPSLLLISDDARHGGVVSAHLAEAGFQSTISCSCEAARTILQNATFKAVVVANRKGCCQCAWACQLRNRIQGRKFPLVVFPDEKSSPVTENTHERDFPIRLKKFLQCFNECASGELLELRDITLDPIGDKVTHRGKPIHLSPIEFRLLAHFMRHPDQVFTPQELLKQVWHRDSDPGRTVAMFVVHLRRALKDHSNSLIETVVGRGYVIKSGRPKRARQLTISQAAHRHTQLQVRPRPRRRKAYGQRALRPRERNLLRLLHLNPGITFSRECIASLIWGLDEVDLRTVDTTVSRIREVFLQHDLCNPIRGVIGWGYQLNGHAIDQRALLFAGLVRSANA